MGFVLPRPKTLKSGAVKARQVIPANVREEYSQLYGVAWEELWRADRATPVSEQKRKYAEWYAEIWRRIEAIRTAKRGDGIELRRTEAAALAGEWYTWFVSRHEENPGKAERWDQEFWLLVDELQRFAPDEVRAEPMRGLEWARDPEIRAGVKPYIADLGCTAQFLASRGVVLTTQARALFLDFVVDNYVDALGLLERRARNDYSPDDTARTFTKFVMRRQEPAGATAWQLFTEWVKAAQPRASTVTRWRAVFKELDRQFPERAADSITPDEAQEWAVSLIGQARTARTVAEVWITAARRVCAWGVKQRKITSNPFAETNVTVPREVRTREREFNDAEVKIILTAALAITDTRKPFPAACRWVPWLCAYSGARAGEITQLRGQDVITANGITAMRLTPGAGTTKTGAPRMVPIHEHVTEQGFLDYVKERGKGPLFYDPAPEREAATSDPTSPRRARYVKQRERLARLGSRARNNGQADTPEPCLETFLQAPCGSREDRKALQRCLLWSRL